RFHSDNGSMLQPHQPDQSANGHCVLQSQLPSFLQNERAILVRISRFQLLSIAALNNRYTHLITIAQAHRQEAGNLAASPHQQNSLLAIFQPDVSPDPHLQIRGKKELSIRVLSFSCLSPST